MIASLTLSPAALAASSSGEFSVAIVASAAAPIGTVEARLSFDPGAFSAERFALASGWVAVDKPGLVLLDNRKGLVVETAGYPGGFSGTTTLGVLTFKAARAGRAAIAVAGASLMLDADNRDEFGAASGAVVTIGGAPPPPPQPPHPAPAPHAPGATSAPPLAGADAAVPAGFFARVVGWLRHLHF